MPTGVIPDPYGNYNFLVEIDGITRAAFQECSGFDSTIDVIEHREGGENTTPRKLPGMTKFSNIQLKWA
jgi:phage tail-like protein